jgi:hypothetical protein
MMEFMPADFEIPFRAVQRMCGEVIKPFDGLYLGNRVVHLRLETYRIRAGGLFPLFVKTMVIEKHDGEIVDHMPFNVSILNSCAPDDCRDE